ncbi:MAG: hypothetical protein ACRBN8_09865 [Nannocystales bacterium]
MRIPSGLFCFVAALAIGACDDPDPVSGGESGGVSDDDDDDPGPDTEGATSATTTGVTTTTDPSGTPTSDPTTTPTPTTMDPTDAESSSSGDPTDPTTSGCTAGTLGCDCDEGECGGGLMCVGDVCVQDVECGIDIYEDNNTEAEAADLGTLGDGDDPVTITGVLEGDEVDWFTYIGEDNLLGSVAPARELTTAGALRMCKFVECANDLFATEVTCPEGTAVAESPGGRPGCCGDDSFEIELNCLNVLDDEAQVWIRFDQGLADCTQFTLEYQY